MELATYCRVCLESKQNICSLYLHEQQKYLPTVIENICGVLISSFDEPNALICKECAQAIVRADEVILKCQDSNRIILEQRAQTTQQKTANMKNKENSCWQFDAGINKYQEEQLLLIQKAIKKPLEPNLIHSNDEDNYTTVDGCMLPADTSTKQSEQSPAINFEVKTEQQDANDLTGEHGDNLFVEPEMFVESILENSKEVSVTNETVTKRSRKTKNVKTGRSKKKAAVVTVKKCSTISAPMESSATIYHSTFKITKPKKKFIRDREQYLKRKIRNYPVKEPLTLIGGAGVVRKRKPKSFHRAIPNFYFRCELCHEFESNVASYAVTHLNAVHGIERPAIFRCVHCDAKPFIKNQSLQEHIATIHQQRPKPRDFVCIECGKTFIKNCHLQKHLLSVHKHGDMTTHCSFLDCGKGYMDSIGQRLQKKQTNSSALASDCRERSFACESCDQTFFDIQGLRLHMNIEHPTETYSCPQCGYKFRQKARFDAHVKRGRCKPPSFACRHCARTFRKLHQMEEHTTIAHAACKSQIQYY